MPVTTTIGLPSLSRGADMVPPWLLRRIQKRSRAVPHERAAAPCLQERLRSLM
jgi:hypothetical protein